MFDDPQKSYRPTPEKLRALWDIAMRLVAMREDFDRRISMLEKKNGSILGKLASLPGGEIPGVPPGEPPGGPTGPTEPPPPPPPPPPTEPVWSYLSPPTIYYTFLNQFTFACVIRSYNPYSYPISNPIIFGTLNGNPWNDQNRISPLPPGETSDRTYAIQFLTDGTISNVWTVDLPISPSSFTFTADRLI